VADEEQEEQPMGTGSTWEPRVGDVVRVRSARDIIATLDQAGEYEALPFMPEMLRYCGEVMTVYKVAHKLCDTISGTGMRRMEHAVHLTGARCDGSAHGGCQAACMLYWKTAWLDPDVTGAVAIDPADEVDVAGTQMLHRMTRAEGGDEPVRYRCQATEMLRAAPEPLPVRAVGQFVADVRTGNTSVGWAVRAFVVALFNRVQDVAKHRLPPRLLLHGGRRWGDLEGRPGPTPTARSGLEPGETVRIKSRDEIAETLDVNRRNRGMGFDAETARHCGKTARVLRRVEHIIDEKDGRMITMREPCIVLDDVICEGALTSNCPRAITPYFREIWLERTAPLSNAGERPDDR
jgi:hypothetical protein